MNISPVLRTEIIVLVDELSNPPACHFASRTSWTHIFIWRVLKLIRAELMLWRYRKTQTDTMRVVLSPTLIPQSHTVYGKRNRKDFQYCLSSRDRSLTTTSDLQSRGVPRLTNIETLSAREHCHSWEENTLRSHMFAQQGKCPTAWQGET